MKNKVKLSKTAKSILAGLEDLKAYLDGDLSRVTEFKLLPSGEVVKVKHQKKFSFANIIEKIRKTLKMTREQFADAFKLNKYNVRNWERGDREPPEYMKAYLKIIAADPWDAYKKLHS